MGQGPPRASQRESPSAPSKVCWKELPGEGVRAAQGLGVKEEGRFHHMFGSHYPVAICRGIDTNLAMLDEIAWLFNLRGTE